MIKDLLLDSLLTKKCRFCGKTILPRETVCADCQNEIPLIKGKRCKYCGAERKRCTCKGHRMQYDGITSPFYYEGAAKTALLQLKFGGRDYTAYSLAEDMKNCVLKDFEEVAFDFITYVPFTSEQRLSRDYNQSELLAEALSEALEIPLRTVLIKLFEISVQHSIGGSRRTGNVAGAYDVRENAEIKGKTVLLVDDIKTTGATLNECAKILKIRGADRVFCVTAALSGKKIEKDENGKKS